MHLESADLYTVPEAAAAEPVAVRRRAGQADMPRPRQPASARRQTSAARSPERNSGRRPSRQIPNSRSRTAARPRRAADAKKSPRSRSAVPRRKASTRRARTRAMWRGIFRWVVALSAAFLLALGIRNFVCEVVRVADSSMNPALASDELVFVTKYDYIFSGPKRGDVVVCRYPNREGTFIKRVVGLPGDTLLMRNGNTYINDVLLNEDYVSYPAPEDYGPLLVGDGRYIVMGDNRPMSHDSRAADVGALRAFDILGRARRVLYPFGSARTIGA